MTPYEGPHVGHGGAGGAGARQRQIHPASVSVREDREAAGEAGEEAGERVARLPEAGAEAEHVALLLHLCVTITDLGPKFSSPQSLRDGPVSAAWVPGVGP